MQRVIHDILYFFESYFLGASICGLLVEVGYIIHNCRQEIQKMKREQTLRGVLIFLFSAYIYIVIGITLLSREPQVKRVVQLFPFATFHWNCDAMKYVIENILLFIPMGVFIRILWYKRVTFKFLICIAIVSSIFIELLQYATRRGRMETDDVIMNTLGALIGWWLTHLLSKIGVYQKRTQRWFE